MALGLFLVAGPSWGEGLFPVSPFSNGAAATTAAAFLKLPNGARYEALGGAAAGAVEGAESLFWNPAGLGCSDAQTPSEVSLSYSALLESFYAGGAAYAIPRVGPGGLAVGLTYFSQSALTSYSALGDAAGSFTPYDMAVAAGYGAALGGLRVGAALKIIHSSLADQQGTTAAVDVGVQAPHVTDLGSGPFDVAAAVTNFGPALKLGSVASPLPFAVRLGTKWRANPAFNALFDLVAPVDQDPYVSVGAEACLKQSGWAGFLRLGFNQSHTRNISGLTGVTGGAGLDLRRLRIDYAWVPFGDLGMTNRVTLAFRF